MQGSSTCDDETKHSTPRPQRLRSSRKRIVRDDDDAQDPIPVAKRQRGPPTPPPTDVVDLTTPPPEFPEKLVAAVKVKVERSDSLLDRSFTMSVQPLVGKDTALLEQLQNLLRQYQASMILKRPDLEHAVLAVLRSSEIPQDVFDKFAGMCYRGVEGGAVRPNSSLGEWLKERWVQNMMNGDAGQQRAQ
ncbi:hypothetical protein CERZMDRAFT_90062 [Cercospora zeae-maydis SCOH1-5]|uniref:Uncharacterized protein n=1 Tax=Cercospora zeae-maydis SCOH1-5 TaxID=717836 RepID=A0A6A6FRR8_9PEZI|nr:hypothetical protein CERZMDRAFT_90062 [Cercospora zeae-maydis SCOH1-5]